jgi:hypothetical protein
MFLLRSVSEAPFEHAHRFALVALTSSLALLGCTKRTPQAKLDEEHIATTSQTNGRVDLDAGLEDASTFAPSCGTEINVHGKGYDAAARDCFLEAHEKGREAGLVITVHTIEGDPITFTLRALANKQIEVTEDNRDRFGARGVRRATCTSIGKSSRESGRYAVVLRGCGDARPEITIP